MEYRQLGDSGLRVSVLTPAPEEIARHDEVGRPPLLHPYCHQAPTAKDRLSKADRVPFEPHL